MIYQVALLILFTCGLACALYLAFKDSTPAYYLIFLMVATVAWSYQVSNIVEKLAN